MAAKAKLSAVAADQRFECRDCPARCCRMPWSIRFSEEETKRYLDDEWVRERAGAEGARVLARGVLPVREHDRKLQCVFLDEDELCSLQKKFGHAYIPRACQTFPFGFVRNEKDVVVPQLSRLCPSIRDNYGKPVDKRALEAKLEQRGGPQRMSTALVSVRGTIVNKPQYLRVASFWSEQLSSDASPAATLARMYDWTEAFEDALPLGADRVDDAGATTAIARAKERSDEPLVPRDKSSFHARVLFAYLLGNLCYPSRVRQAHRVDATSWTVAVRSFGNKLAWMLERGTVDMLFVDQPVRLGRVRNVARFLAEPEGVLVRDYLRQVIERRHIFGEPRHLRAAVLDLALGAVVISRFARCRAAAAGRTRVKDDDVREGIGVAELVLLSHAALSEQGKVMKNLRWLLLTQRQKLRDVLASEA